MLKEPGQAWRSRITRNAGSLLLTHGMPRLSLLSSQTFTVGGAELLLAQPVILEPLTPEVDLDWARPMGHCRHYCLTLRQTGSFIQTDSELLELSESLRGRENKALRSDTKKGKGMTF